MSLKLLVTTLLVISMITHPHLVNADEKGIHKKDIENLDNNKELLMEGDTDSKENSKSPSSEELEDKFNHKYYRKEEFEDEKNNENELVEQKNSDDLDQDISKSLEVKIEEQEIKPFRSTSNEPKTANEWLEYAASQPDSSSRLKAYIEGHKLYPNDSRFIEGINKSARSLLNWASEKHQEGDYETAIDRYNLILSAPALDSKIKRETEIKLKYAEEGKDIPTANSLYNRAQNKPYSSDRLSIFIEGYVLYPNDSRFIEGINKSARSLLNWASEKHQEGDYETAIDRYNLILSAPALDSKIKQEAEYNLNYAKQGKRTVELYYKYAISQQHSSDRLTLFIEGHSIYGGAKLIKEGINKSARSLLDWASEKHKEGDYETAIDRYNLILSAPALDSKIKQETESKHKSALHSLAHNQPYSSDRLSKFIEGYKLYPNDSRFIEGINKSARSLLNWASEKHQEGDYETAIDRYNLILSAPALDSKIKQETESKHKSALHSLAHNQPYSSDRLSKFIEGYKLYPNDSRFIEGINKSARSLLNWASEKHQEGDYETAIDRYNLILSAPALDSKIKRETEIKLKYAEEGKDIPTANSLYNRAQNKPYSSDRLSIFIEGYVLYPNDSRFIEGINKSARSLLNWASEKHQEGDYETAIDRYNLILSAPALDSKIKQETEIKLKYAERREKIPSAEKIYEEANNHPHSSERLRLFVEGYILYPEDKRFLKGIEESAQSLLNWAMEQHRQRKFETAIERYNRILNAPGVPESIRNQALKNLELAKKGEIPFSRTIITYTDYNISFEEALRIQMTRSPKTTTPRGYVHKDYIKNGRVNISSGHLNVRSSASMTGNIIGKLEKGQKVTILGQKGDWLDVSYSAPGLFHDASEAAVAEYLDPNNNDIFQHLVLTESVGVSAKQLNKVLAGRGILSGMGQAFIDGGRKYSVNEVYLISHAILETGNGTSQLAKGVEVGKNRDGHLVLVTSSNRSSLTNIRTTYNMFGVGAHDGNAVKAGATYAYEQGWFTPEDAIIGGSKFIAQRYIHNSYKQNTLYKMRWNPANPGYPQYATDIGWAVKQVPNIKNLYEQLTDPVMHFDIPRYK
ncbi:N-acetylglucosaminidase [Novibacillus thermophilus]|uniref:N-acetylglucosaminidase n=1 Tax=Novibacillus thermophilus TaxID=1471761 RepID=UPI0014754925|nr:N-acetylglucosaminidase [Novibacillus thermophilus]